MFLIKLSLKFDYFLSNKKSKLHVKSLVRKISMDNHFFSINSQSDRYEKRFAHIYNKQNKMIIVIERGHWYSWKKKSTSKLTKAGNIMLF